MQTWGLVGTESGLGVGGASAALIELARPVCKEVDPTLASMRWGGQGWGKPRRAQSYGLAT